MSDTSDPMVALAASIKDAAGLVVDSGETYQGVKIRHGQVTAVTLSQTGTTCSVLVSGGVTLTGVRCMSNYVPYVNDAVVMLAYPGGRLLAVGSTSRGDATAGTFTPQLGNGWANGNATTAGWYSVTGKVCHFWARIVLGTTSTLSTNWMSLSLPVAADTGKNSTYSVRSTIHGALEDNSATGQILAIGGGFPTSTSVQLLRQLISAAPGSVFGDIVTNTTPFTWTSPDSITYGGWYFVA